MYDAIGARNHNAALWSTFHKRYYQLDELREMPWWSKVDKILILGQESDNTDWVHADSRIYVWDSRIMEDQPRFYSYFWWWHQTLEMEQYLQGCSRLRDPRVYPPNYRFEAVFRAKFNRPYRRFLLDCIVQSDELSTKCLHTNGTRVFGTDIEKECNWPDDTIYFDGSRAATSASLIPYHIYNDSWFSFLVETRTDYNFFTEKTAKLLLSNRMFIAFGAQNLLKDLHTLGFETFDDVIDESYDAIEDTNIRWQMALEQCKLICAQDPKRLYDKILPKLQHNRQHLLSMDINLKAQQQMIEVLHGK